jgi:hypothetical protein
VPDSRRVLQEAAPLIPERVEAWRKLHDQESMISGSADGWFVLATLDELVNFVRKVRDYSNDPWLVGRALEILGDWDA